MLSLLRICLGVMAAPLLLADGAADIFTPAFLPPVRPLGVPQSGMSLCKIGHRRGFYLNLAAPSRYGLRDVRVDLSVKKKDKQKKPGGGGFGGFGKLGKTGPLKKEGGGFNDGADLEELSQIALEDSPLDHVSAYTLETELHIFNVSVLALNHQSPTINPEHSSQI